MPSRSRRAEGAARVLIIDDDVGSAQEISRMLHASGHDETRVEHSAETGLRAAVDFTPNIVLVDIEMPGQSGYDVALLLRQHPRLQRVRLIALTETRGHPRRELARASGFERYLVKPVTPDALQKVLDVPSRSPESVRKHADSAGR